MKPSARIKEARISLWAWILFLGLGLLIYASREPKTAMYMSLLVIVLLGIVLAGYVPVLRLENVLRKETDNILLQSLGHGYNNFAPNVKRSSDGARQFRLKISLPPGAVNLYAEMLKPNTELVLKSSAIVKYPGYLEDDRRKWDVGHCWIAFVQNPLTARTVSHYKGALLKLSGDHDESLLLPIARSVIINQIIYTRDSTQDYFVWRTDATSAYLGETWHRSLKEVQNQLEYEYGDNVSPWQLVPRDIDDVVAFAAKKLV